MKRFFALALAGLLLLACGACGDSPADPSANNEPTTTLSQEAEALPLSPAFLPLDTGVEALKPLIYGSDGWRLGTQGDYIFAHFWRHIVRYNVKINKIDKIIDLGDAPQYWWYASTYSPDGRFCVAQAQEFDGPGHTGKVHIDLKNETVKPTEQEHFSHSFDSNPYQVEARLMEHGYGWFLNDVEVWRCAGDLR